METVFSKIIEGTIPSKKYLRMNVFLHFTTSSLLHRYMC